MEANVSSGCFDPLERAQSWQTVVSFLLLVAIDIAIIIGNVLVVAAVAITKKLRTTTNMFICSLAVADLLVGVAVLPYSLTLEVLDMWLFGELWCSLWLAVDVLLCTASILHLCAISLDRYLAIAYPIHYPRLMSSTRGKSLIVAVWLVAFVVCIPPLLGWNEAGLPFRGSLDDENNQNASINNVSVGVSVSATADCRLPQCSLIADKGYRVYSALGSFFIPMFVMIFFYWRIFVQATRSSREMQRGFKEVTGRETLRIHRGGGTLRLSNKELLRSHSSSRDSSTDASVTVPSISRKKPRVLSLTRTVEARKSGRQESTSRVASRTEQGVIKAPSSEYNVAGEIIIPLSDGFDEMSIDGDTRTKRIQKVLKIRRDFKRLSREMKAAKTLAVIVGAFIFCWLPFFTVYFLEAFCERCIKPLVFSICFWLGYCNSALDPLIYAMFNKDYRYAFHRILRCKISHGTTRSSSLTDSSRTCPRLSEAESPR